MRVNIYQLKEDSNVKFMDYDFTQSRGGIDPADYRCVFRGHIEGDSLEDVYAALNGDHPGTYQGHSLSVSDVVETVDGNGSEFHFCDAVGWKNVPFDSSQCAEMEGLRVLMLQPHQPPVETRVMDDLDHWQRAVSDHGEDALMEVTYPFEDNCVVVGNEEAKLNGMEGNRRVEGSVYAGPIFLVGDNGEGEFCSLTDDQIEHYAERFTEPEVIPQEEVQADSGFFLFGFD